MRPSLQRQLGDYFAYVDETQGAVEVLDLIEPVTPMLDVISPATGRGSRRVRPLAMLAAFVVVVLAGIAAGLVLLTTGDDPDVASAPPLDDTGLAVSQSFMDAWVGGDGEAAARLFNTGGTYAGTRFRSDGTTLTEESLTGLDQLKALHDWYGAVGWEFHNLGCRSDAVATPDREGVVSCSVTFENDLGRALGWEPIRDVFLIVVDGEGIEHASERFGFDAYRDLWFTFKDWVAVTHPNDLEHMFLYPTRSEPEAATYTAEPPFEALYAFPVLDETSTALWERYVDEFVDSPTATDAAREELALARYVSQAVSICREEDDAFTADVAGLVESETINFQQFFVGFADLKAEAAWHEAAARHADVVTAKLQALPAPPRNRGQLSELFAFIEEEAALLRQIAAAADAGNTTLVETLQSERVDATHRRSGAASELGFGLWACPIELPA